MNLLIAGIAGEQNHVPMINWKPINTGMTCMLMRDYLKKNYIKMTASAYALVQPV